MFVCIYFFWFLSKQSWASYEKNKVKGLDYVFVLVFLSYQLYLNWSSFCHAPLLMNVFCSCSCTIQFSSNDKQIIFWVYTLSNVDKNDLSAVLFIDLCKYENYCLNLLSNTCVIFNVLCIKIWLWLGLYSPVWPFTLQDNFLRLVLKVPFHGSARKN